MKKTAVIFETFAGTIRTSSWEALSCAVELSSDSDDEIHLIIPAPDAEQTATDPASLNIGPVTAIQTDGSYNSETTKAILSGFISEREFTHVCIAGTTQGLDYAPGLAARLGMLCLTGIEKVVNTEGALFLERAILGGKIVETCPLNRNGIVIVTQPGTFQPYASQSDGQATVDTIVPTVASEVVKTIEVKQVQQENSDLAEASIIISAGRGIKEAENLELIQQLSEVFTKSAIGGSRPLCDLQWLEYRQQVGITGATVTPDLYLACGISGAAQHISGMRNAGYIVSINIDPKAAIFNYSDVCIVEDLTTFIPVLIETFNKLKQSA